MIEIGKKYEIVNSWNGHDGTIVTVTGYGGKELGGCSTMTGDRWYVDREFETTFGYKVNHMGEKQLKPIYDGNEMVSWNECDWQPIKEILYAQQCIRQKVGTLCYKECGIFNI